MDPSKQEALAGSDIFFNATMQTNEYQNLTQTCSVIKGMFCHTAVTVRPKRKLPGEDVPTNILPLLHHKKPCMSWHYVKTHAKSIEGLHWS